MPSRKQLADAIRVLSMDAVQKANSGHPGAPLGMADLAEVVWNDFLRHDPAEPQWPNRDRFVFSNGHGSMLLYSLLHLSGYDLSIEDLKQFRQLHSKTPGHPEYRVTPGVESTSGPLGQGIACAVGMALSEKLLSEEFNTDEHSVVDHHTYVFMGDGCLMEGISHECCSLAGTLGLGKLIALYDDNDISIDGNVAGWFTDDTPARFASYGWHVVPDVDGHDPESVHAAMVLARSVDDRPSLICCKTVIGFGAPNVCGTSGCHGSPLGEEEIAAAREVLRWPHGQFEIPQDVYDAWDARELGEARRKEWEDVFESYKKMNPVKASEFNRRMRADLPAAFESIADAAIADCRSAALSLASRKASGAALEKFAPILPELIGGSADLSGSNNTKWSGSIDIEPESVKGNYINFGVREFAMAAMMNGMALHGGYIPYAGTFLVFSDYMRSAMRMSALMKIRVIYVLTHDSIGVGEDGPTHQPVEHVASLRMMPGMRVWRPCDAVETTAAWKFALTRADGPSALALSRQGLPHQQRGDGFIEDMSRGGYVLKDCDGLPEAILLAAGSEVAVVMDAAEKLAEEGKKVRVVSMPCLEAFAEQDDDYKESVLPKSVAARVAVEAGRPESWHKYVGRRGAVVGMETYGESAPGKTLFEHFGFTPDKVVETVKSVIADNEGS